MGHQTKELIPLSQVVPGSHGFCFAVLDRKEWKHSPKGPFLICHFKARDAGLASPVFDNHPLWPEAREWQERTAFRLEFEGVTSPYGLQLKLENARSVTDADRTDGFEESALFEVSRYPVDESFDRIQQLVDSHVSDPHVAQLVRDLLNQHAELFKKMPAAAFVHHEFTGGLVEHVRSVARVAALLADHYARYYTELEPPLNKSVIVAAAILHDIGKLIEFEYRPGGATYTPRGRLVGHIVMGWELIRQTAGQIEGFPEETLMLLEHAVLAHHGGVDTQSPRQPQTLEALIVHYVDELDAKLNSGVRALLHNRDPADVFTRKVFAWDNRRIYQGLPREPQPENSPPTPESPQLGPP